MVSRNKTTNIIKSKFVRGKQLFNKIYTFMSCNVCCKTTKHVLIGLKLKLYVWTWNYGLETEDFKPLLSWSQQIIVFIPMLFLYLIPTMFRSNHPEVFLEKGVWKYAANLHENTRAEVWFQNFIEITLRHGCSPVNLLHIFRTHFSRNTSGWLLLNVASWSEKWSDKWSSNRVINDIISYVFTLFIFILIQFKLTNYSEYEH